MPKAKPVLRSDWKVFPSARAAAAAIPGADAGGVINVCNGRRVTAYGYRWRWLEDVLRYLPLLEERGVELEVIR